MIAKLFGRPPAPSPGAKDYGPPPGAPLDLFYVDERRIAAAEAAVWIPRRSWFSRRQPDDPDRR